MEQILSRYNSAKDRGGLELEVRFGNITKETFLSLASSVVDGKEFVAKSVECAVNIICSDKNTQWIQRIIYNGDATTRTYHKKTRLGRAQQYDYLPYRVSLSREEQVKPFKLLCENPHIRFKVRLSANLLGGQASAIVAEESPKWRFDLTAVRQGSLEELGSLKLIRSHLFGDCPGVSNFIQSLKHEHLNRYEVELEYLGDEISKEDLHVVKKVFQLINPAYLNAAAYRDELFHVARWIFCGGEECSASVRAFRDKKDAKLRDIINQARTISKHSYYKSIYPPIGYYITEKADGHRAIVSINGNRCRILTERDLIEHIDGDEFRPGAVTIVDAERLADGRVLLFDVIAFDSKPLAAEEFSSRIGHLEKAAELISKFVPAVAKRYVRLDHNLEEGFRQIYPGRYDYLVDGIILTEPGMNYSKTHNYKWKPYSHNTIDFLCVRAPANFAVPEPLKGQGTLYLLFVGISQKVRDTLGPRPLREISKIFADIDPAYGPIQFAPSANPWAYIYYHNGPEDLDRKIIELRRSDDGTAWEFVRIREDRRPSPTYYGNNYQVAENTYMNYIDRFRFEDLFRRDGGYFEKTASHIYTTPNKYKRFVISMVFKRILSGARWVIDEAAGRGADLHRYYELGVENALFIDNDPTAMAELIERKFSLINSKRRASWLGDDTITKPQVHRFMIHTLVADLRKDSAALVSDVYQFGAYPGEVDCVVCNFALHYLCGRIEDLRNLLMFNATMLKTGGVFMFTVMDGAAVHELLKPYKEGQTWESREGDVVKYAIKKKYDSAKLLPAGQMISVLLPFSSEMYDEPLCNIDTVIKEAKALGFEPEENSSMDTMFEDFAKVDSGMYSKLTDEDKKYIALHRYVTLRLVQRKRGGATARRRKPRAK